MNARELKDKFIQFFVKKGHKEIPSASLIPQDDPTTLFVSAGMHPLVPYLLGSPHPLGKRLVNVQRCLRTTDINQVGDAYHHTFFEMLGNWSLGDYFKKDSISWSYQFLVQELKINPRDLLVTCFAGDQHAPKDIQSARIWKSLGINQIKFLPKKDNWWGPAGATGPCGPDTEIFSNGVEIWNNVFMEYSQTSKGQFVKLPAPNVDTGMGVERTVALLAALPDNYLTSIWQPIIQKIENISGKNYQADPKPFRIIADHLRAAVFIINDGVEPSNKEAGYVLRRLIRRAIVQARQLGINFQFTSQVGQAVIANQANYAGSYEFNSSHINQVLDQEEVRFSHTLDRGLSQIQKLIAGKQKLSGQDAFDLYQNFGFPPELTQEIAQKHGLKINLKAFAQAQAKHRQLSQTLSAGRFKSGLSDHSAIAAKYHTATHLLHAALRQVLGNHVTQTGSNITPQRLRFDFTHSQPLTNRQIGQVENLVNQKIKAGLPVNKQTMPLSAALKSKALALFKAKYPPTVSVFSINSFSREICAGPHVKNTRELGIFKIIKQESSGSGRRRLYAVLQ